MSELRLDSAPQDFRLQPIPKTVPLNFEIEAGLEIEPEPLGRTKIT
jgi:hypothetical protein